MSEDYSILIEALKKAKKVGTSLLDNEATARYTDLAAFADEVLSVNFTR